MLLWSHQDSLSSTILPMSKPKRIQPPVPRDPVKVLQEFLQKENLVLTPTPYFKLKDDGSYGIMFNLTVAFGQ